MFEKVHADTAAFQMDARAAYAIDAESGQVLYQKNATKRYPIASVIKILTLGVILQDIRNGIKRLRLHQQLPRWQMIGTFQMSH